MKTNVIAIVAGILVISAGSAQAMLPEDPLPIQPYVLPGTEVSIVEAHTIPDALRGASERYAQAVVPQLNGTGGN